MRTFRRCIGRDRVDDVDKAIWLFILIATTSKVVGALFSPHIKIMSSKARSAQLPRIDGLAFGFPTFVAS